MKRLDNVGQRFGTLTVIANAPSVVYGNGQRRSIVVVRCDCGVEKAVQAQSLRAGQTQSCGRHNRRRLTHGRSKTAGAYSVWCGIHRRCYNQNEQNYPRYGGRGIRVCERWDTFENFLTDMGERPLGNMQIERRDNDGNYEPVNCYWATLQEQARNRRSTINITFNGETHCLTEWATRLGINYNMLKARICDLKWSPERALTEPSQARFRHTARANP